MVTIDLVVNVVGGVGSASFNGATKFKALCVVPVPPGSVWDFHVVDEIGNIVGGTPTGNSGPTTFLEPDMKMIPTLPRGGTLAIANATKDGIYNARIYSELTPTHPQHR